MIKASVPSEELFLNLFTEVFGPEKTALLYPQFEFVDIYHNTRYADFVVDSGAKRIAIEIDGEAVHNKNIISNDKFDDDQLKQNSMISYGWDVYRWSYRKLKKTPDTVKDEIMLFIGDNPSFTMANDYLPSQQGGVLSSDFELREHQLQALENLDNMRREGKTIALICQATGVGKTVVAVSDAKKVGGRTLFLAHTKDLVVQASKTFEKIWNEKKIGFYVDGEKQKNTDIVCGSIQSVALNIEEFSPNEFDYIIIDEAHHASSDSYQKVIGYFTPKFLLGLTATPERTDQADILEIFKSVAHKLDIKTAVEMGLLCPVRCIRVKTNIDISDVRFNGVKYNAQDLEQKLYVPERNKLIVDTYLKTNRDGYSVIFCVSVKHAEEIARLLNAEGVVAKAVSGAMSLAERKEIMAQYENGKVQVLCACDLLNEGWDSPKTRTLFMARPTMSKVLYTQQLGRGMRLAEGKNDLLVFDFVDNANMFNSAYTLHKLLNINKYREGGLVLGKQSDMLADERLYNREERPDLYIGYPISAMDYEIVDVFNWQNEAAGMISQMQLIRMVDVQSETIERMIREKKIVADLEVPSGSRVFRYFTEEKVLQYAKDYDWTIITRDNKKDMFMEMVEKMDMSYSYKPVFLKALFEHIDDKGRCSIDNIVDYFIDYYESRRDKGQIVEKKKCIYLKEDYTRNEVQRNILSNPFSRFEQMSAVKHSKSLGIIELDKDIHRKLTKEDIDKILDICDKKLEEYYSR